MASKFCKKCGSKLETNAQFCTNCGAKVGETIDEKESNVSNPKSGHKISKKSWIVIAIVAVILVCGGFLYNTLTNPKGVWLGDSNATVLDIENGGTGYYYEYGYSTTAATISWKKIGFNKIQIKYDDDGDRTVFNATLKNGKLNAPDETNWNAEKFKRTNKSLETAKSDVKSYMNPTMSSLINSSERHIWISAANYDEGADKCFNNKAEVDSIYVTQNGKSTYYLFDNDKDILINKFNKMSDDEVIEYAKKNIDKKWNHGQPKHYKPVDNKYYKNDVNADKIYRMTFERGNYQYTGFAGVSFPGTNNVSTDMCFLRIHTIPTVIYQ